MTDEKEYDAVLRIPSSTPYAYVEVSVCDTPSNILSLQRQLEMQMAQTAGLSDKEYNTVLDSFLWDKKGFEEHEWTRMNPAQQSVFQEIKKSRKRKAYQMTNKE